MVLARFPSVTGLVSTPPMLHPCFSLASSASCDAFTEQQTSFMEPSPYSTQARSSLGKNKKRDFNRRKAVDILTNIKELYTHTQQKVMDGKQYMKTKKKKKLI